jgi:hypothetical protein
MVVFKVETVLGKGMKVEVSKIKLVLLLQNILIM